MKILYTIPAKNGRKIEIYQFASGNYARLVDNDGFVFADSRDQSMLNGGTLQSALKFAYDFIN